MPEVDANAMQWGLIAALGSTGVVMALLSSLVGLRQVVEIPLWWGFYAVWVVLVRLLDVSSPFLTILLASIFAGIVHGLTQGLLVDHYKKNNPWYEDLLKGTNTKLTLQFLMMGLMIGSTFGALVGGIAWGISKI